MNFLHSFLLTVKMGSGFPLFSSTRLVVSKKDPTVIVASRKYLRCFPRYPPVYCTTTTCPCREFGKILQVHFKLRDTQDMMKVFIYGPL